MLTSCNHSNNFSGDKQTNIVAFLIGALVSFFKDETNSLSRGENHYSSGHVQNLYFWRWSQIIKAFGTNVKNKYCLNKKKKIISCQFISEFDT